MTVGLFAQIIFVVHLVAAFWIIVGLVIEHHHEQKEAFKNVVCLNSYRKSGQKTAAAAVMPVNKTVSSEPYDRTKVIVLYQRRRHPPTGGHIL